MEYKYLIKQYLEHETATTRFLTDLADFAQNRGSMDGGGYEAIKFQNNYEKGYDEEYELLEKNKVMYWLDARISPTHEDLDIIVEGYEFYEMLCEAVVVFKERYPDLGSQADAYMLEIKKVFDIQD